jgi:UDP-glucose 4-epimerase
VLVASSDKIRSELGWTPQFADLEMIVASAWEWHRKNPNGYEQLTSDAQPERTPAPAV